MRPDQDSPVLLPAMPADRRYRVLDSLESSASAEAIFAVARRVEEWPAYLRHYRYVRYRERAGDGSGLVEMSANRPFGPLGWPTWWLSQYAIDTEKPALRFRHVGGVTRGMEVEWTFTPREQGTLVRIEHLWNGPGWPLIGDLAAGLVIGPVFVHGIAERTLAGIIRVAERG